MFICAMTVKYEVINSSDKLDYIYKKYLKNNNKLMQLPGYD